MVAWEGEGDGIPNPTDDALEDGADALELPVWELVERGARPPEGWPPTPRGVPFPGVDYWSRELAWPTRKGQPTARVSVAVSGEGSQALPFVIHIGLTVTGSPSMELVASTLERFVTEGCVMQTLFLSGTPPGDILHLQQMGVRQGSPAAFRWELSGSGGIIA